MTSQLGFGKAKAQPKPSKRSQERASAAQQLDNMRAEGTPEFEVYIRVQGKKQWFPVGAIAVKRSALIHHAIYDNEEQLLQGAFRIFPVLRKNQSQLEYGYRLKEFKDDPIQVAERPTQKAIGGLQAAFSSVQSGLTGLFKGKK